MLPEFNRANQIDRYDLPEGIITDFAKDLYYDLLNNINRKPYLSKFKGTEFLKKRY